jgi:hypothetical protein
LRIFASKFIKEIGLYFSLFFFYCVLVFWDECNTGFTEWFWQCSFPFYFMEKIEGCWY